MIIKNMLRAGVASVCLMSAAAFAGGAVSDINAKVETSIGNLDGDISKTIAGSFSTPSYFHDNIGFQVDALYSHVQPSIEVKGFGLHGFWRDSDIGLFGLTGSWVEMGQVEFNRVGFEGEYYWTQFTLGGDFGAQEADLGRDTLYGGIYASYYVHDDLVLQASTRMTDYNTRFAADAEYQLPGDLLSVFATATTGDNSFTQVEAGVRIYLAKEKKSLIRRHREDDPKGLVGDVVSDNSTAPAEAAANAASMDPCAIYTTASLSGKTLCRL